MTDLFVRLTAVKLFKWPKEDDDSISELILKIQKPEEIFNST
jgi:hypothetical protein